MRQYYFIGIALSSTGIAFMQDGGKGPALLFAGLAVAVYAAIVAMFTSK